jgi:Na+-translocating ferredoxin:NAD+ oxidoreductase RnfD subunit
MTTILKSANLALTFLLELALLAAFGYWGFQSGGSTLLKILLGIGVPLLVALIWGVFMAPNSRRRLQGGAYLALKALLFGLAVAALIAAGETTLGAAFAVVVVINTVLLYLWRQ